MAEKDYYMTNEPIDGGKRYIPHVGIANARRGECMEVRRPKKQKIPKTMTFIMEPEIKPHLDYPSAGPSIWRDMMKEMIIKDATIGIWASK
jgi:hypothetical protein